MSADSVPSSKTNIFQNKLIYVAILELIRGAQCLIEVIRSSGEEIWRVDAYQYRITAEVLRERSGLTRGLPIDSIELSFLYSSYRSLRNLKN